MSVFLGGSLEPVTFDDDDARMLANVIRDYLPGLKFEITRTDRAEARHLLLI